MDLKIHHINYILDMLYARKIRLEEALDDLSNKDKELKNRYTLEIQNVKCLINKINKAKKKARK